MENLLFILLNVSKNFLSYKHFNLETVPTGSKKKIATNVYHIFT